MGAPKSPKPADIRRARERIGYSQTVAAEVIYSALRTWQGWEDGSRAMHPALWELWQHKVGVQPAPIVVGAAGR